MTSAIRHHEYLSAMQQIKDLQMKLWRAATQKGNLDPDVIALSQEIDDYILVVQQYWREYRPPAK